MPAENKPNEELLALNKELSVMHVLTTATDVLARVDMQMARTSGELLLDKLKALCKSELE